MVVMYWTESGEVLAALLLLLVLLLPLFFFFLMEGRWRSGRQVGSHTCWLPRVGSCKAVGIILVTGITALQVFGQHDGD